MIISITNIIEYQIIVGMSANTPNQPLKFKFFGLKQMTMHMENITPIVRLNLKLWC